MSRIGVLGGMGPAATVDFMAKLVALTPAHCDQEHLPVVVANFPQVPDRSSAIMGAGPDPLPAMLQGIAALNALDVGVIVVPCNTSHHWYDAMAAASRAPMLHIADASLQGVPSHVPVAILATRGCLKAGIYQKALTARGNRPMLPYERMQQDVDACIRAVKAGRNDEGATRMQQLLHKLRAEGATRAILACTELPLAAAAAGEQAANGVTLIDSTLELARATVRYALDHGWNLTRDQALDHALDQALAQVPVQPGIPSTIKLTVQRLTKAVPA